MVLIAAHLNTGVIVIVAMQRQLYQIDRYIPHLYTPPPPPHPHKSLMVSVDNKHHVYLLYTCLKQLPNEKHLRVSFTLPAIVSAKTSVFCGRRLIHSYLLLQRRTMIKRTHVLTRRRHLIALQCACPELSASQPNKQQYCDHNYCNIPKQYCVSSVSQMISKKKIFRFVVVVFSPFCLAVLKAYLQTISYIIVLEVSSKKTDMRLSK